MKKVRLSLLVVLFAIATAAQAQMNFGVKAGLNMSNVYGDELNDNNMKVGFHAGVVGDMDFSNNVGLRTGLLFSTKGYKFKSSSLEYTNNLMYLELPIHVAYNVEVSPGTKIAFHGGPYLAYGVSGKRSLKLGSIEGSSGNVFGDGTTQLKPFDAGLGIGVGFDLDALFFDLGWDFGLVNMSNLNNGNIKNQNAYLSVGVKF